MFSSIVLASSSPRRRALLQQIGIDFNVMPPHIDETVRPDETPIELVQRLSLEKALAIADELSEGIVLGSDTIVVLENQVLGKPVDRAEAGSMLRRLSGRTHTVFTGFALVDAARENRRIVDYGRADVTFRTLDDREIERYVAGGSPMDKAGSYGIQEDLGAVFIEKIRGDYYTIVGLPLTKVYLALRELLPENF